MLYNPLIKSEGQITIVSQTSIMAVSDFFNLDGKKKPKTIKNGQAFISNTATKNTFCLEVKVLVDQLC